MFKSSSLFISALVLCFTLLVSGCGANNSDTKNTADKPGTNADSSAANNATGNKQDNGQEAQTRKITDARGEIEVPAKPARVVVLHNGALDDLLALGVKPVGAPSIVSVNASFPAYLPGTDGISNIGTVDQPSLEAVQALKPDLIIGIKASHEAIYDKLSQIAPTVFVETLGETWKDNLRIHADAVGLSEKGKELLAVYDERTQQLKKAIGDRIAETEISLFRPRDNGIQIYLTKPFAAGILADSGLPRPEAQREDAFSRNITEESIADLDGDAIFWFSRDTAYFEEKVEKSPLWATLKAVQGKKVYHVDWETWMSGNGIQAANKVIDDLFTHLGQ
ncbi:putative siderophore-binding lipoprotein YfiY [Paenibacillus plantiphilus]|uniref:Siderophore-binding lipoprotein YfiY n=1 Tax=Paenibacillus plantiphilus TaxID=2905650 RepID=A0ABN8G9G4_9BACL|nr:iron-siderophore ABC transporter substrate-binding protein [Paenibacillus plantiphilus]CAH1197613.1 putative siderophore-binding lipoprotein YfiY [Paenibacillus plantiphilus]